MSEGKRSDGQRGRDSATPRRLKKKIIKYRVRVSACGETRRRAPRPRVARSAERDTSSAVVASAEGVSRDVDARRAISTRAVVQRPSAPHRPRHARVPRGALARRRPTRPFEKHRFYRRASHLRPGTGHATRGRGAGGHRQAAEQAVRGTRRARERHGVTRVASHAAHSRVPGARKGTGHLEAREPRVRIPESGWVPSAPGGGTSH